MSIKTLLIFKRFLRNEHFINQNLINNDFKINQY